MLLQNFKNVIKFIFEKIKDKNIRWAIIGSTNMVLQGIDVSPNDLDITTNPADLKIFEQEFKEYIIEPISKKPPLKNRLSEFYEMNLRIKGIKVQIIGGYDNDIYFSKVKDSRILFVKLDDVSIPCLSLEAEAKAYSEINRKDKTKLIMDFLKTRK